MSVADSITSFKQFAGDNWPQGQAHAPWWRNGKEEDDGDMLMMIMMIMMSELLDRHHRNNFKTLSFGK